ncbi:amidohydrolase family protein [Streptomyces sp. NPDC052309]|uniref:amidohydrolase family protein n=1 Tax=Streptomyces sp. NPDC052309 TaxID=3155421 RepID=UPI0034237D79
MTATGLVDAHHHVWDLAVRDQDWIRGEELKPLRRSFSLDDLTPAAREAGVTSTVLVQTVTVAEETPELLSLAEEGRLVTGVVGWTDLTAPDVDEALAHLRNLPGGRHLVGIRHQVQNEPDPEWLLRQDVLRGLAAVAAAGLAYDLVIVERQLPAAIRAAALLPQLTFVLDHAGKPAIVTGEREPWAAYVRRFAALPNTVCKLSGLVTEARWDSWTIDDLRPYVQTVLDEFGPDRAMFGSDWPVCTLAASYKEVTQVMADLTSDLEKHERSAVFGTTARRTYGLHDAPTGCAGATGPGPSDPPHDPHSP